MAIGNTRLQAPSIVNKLNIMSYNSKCIQLLRSLLFTLYIHSLCARRRAELARGQRRWAYCRLVMRSRVLPIQSPPRHRPHSGISSLTCCRQTRMNGEERGQVSF